MTTILIYLIGIAISLYITVKTFKQMWLNEGEELQLNHVILAVVLVLFSWFTILAYFMICLLEAIEDPKNSEL